MAEITPLRTAIQTVGLLKLAKGCGVSYQAIHKWEKVRRMPRTEWTGETTYSERIEGLTGGVVTREQLLAKWPDTASDPA